MWWRMNGKAQLVVEEMDEKAQLEAHAEAGHPLRRLGDPSSGCISLTRSFYNAPSNAIMLCLKSNEAGTFDRVL
jgi:hypothetical protein